MMIQVPLHLLAQIGSEVTVTTEELLPQEVLVPSYTKSKNRGHLAAILACKLFDEETLIKSNVQGHKKEKLDPEIINYIRKSVSYIILQKVILKNAKKNGRSVSKR